MEIQLFNGKLDFLLKGNTLMSLCVEEDDDNDDFDEIVLCEHRIKTMLNLCLYILTF